MALLAGSWKVVRILLCGIVCLMPIAASGEKRSMTVDDMLDMVRIDDVVMTPDGSNWQAVTGSAADEIAPGWNPADFTK